MNSLDPWRFIVTDAEGDVILPPPYYGHPFYRDVPSWIHGGDPRDTNRRLFEGAFISGAPVVSGFFDSVKNAVLKYTGTTATNQFIKDQGLEPYVKLAATAVATAYGGPAAGAAAGALSGPVMSLGVKDKQEAAAAQEQVQQISTAVEQQSPELTPAVDIAKDAIEKTATTYHVAKIVNDAKAGKPEALKALVSLKQAADRGDVQAQQVLQLATVIASEQSKAEAAEAGGRDTVSGWVDLIGANMTNILGAELTALSAPGASFGRYGYPYYGSYGSFGYGPFGPFIGAEEQPAPPIVAPGVSIAPRNGLLAEVAPIVAPATGGISVKKELDSQQVLHVEICVDGKCYKTSMDLAPAIALVMQKLAQWHDGAHAPPPQPTTVVQAVEKAIGAATDSMVGVMVGHHVAVMTGGWLSDVGNAIGSTLRKLQPVISAVAVKAAEHYGGPAAGAAAGQLAPVITNLQANALDPKGDPKKKAAAQQALQQISQAAAADPAKAQALAAANQAVKNTTVAYYVKDTAQQAAAGNPAAQKDISSLVQAAQQGDPAAKSTYEVLATTFAEEMMTSEAGAKLWEKVTGRGPGTVSPGMASPITTSPAVSGWYDVVGGTVVVGSFWSKVKNGLLTVTLTKATNQFIKDNKLEPYVKLAATAVATAYGGPAAGAAAGALSGPVMSLGVEDKKQAESAQRSVEGVKEMAQQTDPQLAPAVDIAKAAIDQTATAYQVSQMVKDAKAGNPEAQKALADLQAAASRGDQNAAAALQAAAVLDRALGRDQEQQNAPGPAVGQWYDIADTVIRMAGTTSTSVGCPPYGPAVAGWYDIIGAAIDDTREKARAHAVTKPGTAAGVLITVDGQLHGRGFRNLDDAVSWLDHITRNRGSFTYAAAYEKDADGAAYIQAEEMGRTSQPTPAPTPIPRDAPAMTGWW